MTVADDLARLHLDLVDMPVARERLVRVEAEIARLHKEIDGMARAPYGEYQKMRERAEAAEAEIARLRDGLRLVLRGIPDPMHPSIRPEWVDKIVAAQIVALDLLGENDGEDVEKARALLAEDGAAEFEDYDAFKGSGIEPHHRRDFYKVCPNCGRQIRTETCEACAMPDGAA